MDIKESQDMTIGSLLAEIRLQEFRMHMLIHSYRKWGQHGVIPIMLIESSLHNAEIARRSEDIRMLIAAYNDLSSYC